ncbi:MAG: sugar phosphate isomerase/epimerase [Actinomycetota bacterium]|nr:sugar phosphate isomerase/epimerase [Actinomycetota bacterium]
MVFKPKIAPCAKTILSIKDVLEYGGESGYMAVDCSLDSKLLKLLESERKKFEEILNGNNLEVRYHCAFADGELGHVNPSIAQASLVLFKDIIDSVQRFGARYITVHIGLDRESENKLSWERAVENLSELVGYGNERGVTVCLENLKTGWTSDPQLFLRLVELSGAKVTFDIGHANSSVHANDGGVTAVEFLESVAKHVVNAHIYEAEEPHHIAPRDLSVIGPVLERLLKTGCDWWVIELDDKEEVEHTKTLLQSFLEQYTTTGRQV